MTDSPEQPSGAGLPDSPYEPHEVVAQDGVGVPDPFMRLWTPHRMAYIEGENKPTSDEAGSGCPFCRLPGLPDTDGLTLCRRIKAEPPAPAVILYSGFADDAMTVPALVAGADGIVHKGVPARVLFEAIRIVAGGGQALPPISQPLLRAAGEALDPEDLPVLAMLVDGTTPADVADTLRIDRAALRERTTRMLGRLKVPVPG